MLSVNTRAYCALIYKARSLPKEKCRVLHELHDPPARALADGAKVGSRYSTFWQERDNSFLVACLLVWTEDQRSIETSCEQFTP